MLGKNISKIIVFILLLKAANLLAAQPLPLTLLEAEHLAIASSPELRRYQVMSQALIQESVANSQLSDPKAMIGAINVPTNTFSFTQDDMTMVEVGLEQSFPPGHSRAIKSKQTQALATAEQRKAQAEIATLLQNVRKTWLDLYYWTQAVDITRANQTLLTYLLKSIKSQYKVGKGNLSDVLQIQLESSRLADQSEQIAQQIDTLRAELGRWIGQVEADRPIANRLPHWLPPPLLSVMQRRLQQHPLLKVDAANIEAAHDEVAFAKEQFKPGFTIGVGYGIRQGNMSDGTPRSDMLTSQISMDLPLFTKNRQGRKLQASCYQLEAAQLDQQVHYRDLLQELTEQYAMWQRLGQREKLYEQQLVPEARQNSKAALLAYQSATSDLATVLRAYTNERNIKLEQLQINIERAKVRAALLYLQGFSQ